MEDTCELYIDPEEDEVVFYDVNGKQVKLRDKQEVNPHEMQTKQIHDNCSKLIADNLEQPEGGLLPLNSSITILEDISNFKLSVDNSNFPFNNREGDKYENSQKPDVKFCSPYVNETFRRQELGEEKVIFDLIDLKTPTDKKKRDQVNDELDNKISIHADHNYCTPVKSIIDKSILQTPKTVVKADKDGGFLKVLSEIALVKAEADENSLKDQQKCIDISYIEEDENNDNKENKQSDNEASSPIFKLGDTPIKSHHSPAVKITNSDDKSNFLTLSCEKLNKDNTEEEYLQLPNVNEGQNLDIHKTANHDIVDQFNVIDNNEVNDIMVVFEKLGDNVLKSENVVATKTLINIQPELFDQPKEQVKENSEKSLGLAEDISNVPHVEMDLVKGNNNSKYVRSGLVETLGFPQKETSKKYIRRKTLMLLEELNGIVKCDQAKRKSQNVDNLPEEAAKVIEKLKSVGIDDSICSPNQYSDQDTSSNSFLHAELSDILNDTSSKPLSSLTNIDLELLLEKITNCAFDENSHSESTPLGIRTEVLDSEKENFSEVNDKKYFDRIPHKTPDIKFSDTSKSARTPNTLKVPDYNSSKCTSDKVNGNIVSETEVVRKVLQQPQSIPKRLVGCQNDEKSVKQNVTRIPKLASAAGKITVSLKETKVQSDRKPGYRTPFPKTRKCLKFNNIESPVQAYINSKTPVLISTVKAKPESTFNVWMKNVDSATKPVKADMKNSVTKRDTKPNLGYVKYKSGIPLKLEKSPESRLPKLTPKIQKLIGTNSPMTVKHEGRIQLNSQRRPHIKNGQQHPCDSNEVSVIVRNFAQKSHK